MTHVVATRPDSRHNHRMASSPTSEPAPPNEERVFFRRGDALVTLQRFVAGGRTYAMSGATAVSMHRYPPRRYLLIVLALAAGVAAFVVADSGERPAAYIVGALGGLLLIFALFRRSTYSIRLMTASGESQALVSKVRGYISAVVAGLNRTQIERG